MSRNSNSISEIETSQVKPDPNEEERNRAENYMTGDKKEGKNQKN